MTAHANKTGKKIGQPRQLNKAVAEPATTTSAGAGTTTTTKTTADARPIQTAATRSTAAATDAKTTPAVKSPEPKAAATVAAARATPAKATPTTSAQPAAAVSRSAAAPAAITPLKTAGTKKTAAAAAASGAKPAEETATRAAIPKAEAPVSKAPAKNEPASQRTSAAPISKEAAPAVASKATAPAATAAPTKAAAAPAQSASAPTTAKTTTQSTSTAAAPIAKAPASRANRGQAQPASTSAPTPVKTPAAATTTVSSKETTSGATAKAPTPARASKTNTPATTPAPEPNAPAPTTAKAGPAAEADAATKASPVAKAAAPTAETTSAAITSKSPTPEAKAAAAATESTSAAITQKPATPADTKKPSTTKPTATTAQAAAVHASVQRSAPAATQPATKTASPIKSPDTTPAATTETETAAPARPAAEPLPRATPSGPEAPEATVGTDAAFASTVPVPPALHTLRNISEVRHFFRTNDVPIFFIGATPFNLLGLDRWVRNFTYISYYDAWDGAHPRVFTPINKPYREFGAGEEINNWLLLNPEVRARMTKDLRPGVRPKVAMVFFDEETEMICDELGYDLILPSAELRARLDSKIVTTRMGNEAGVPSVPNVLTKGSDWATLRREADAARLGAELVVQTPYGDSGKTTFFINSEADWDEYSPQIVGEEIKVMRRINNLPVAVEAVLTRSGTVVGPFLTELAGHRDLTPYPGGWCGNEMHPDVLTEAQRAAATDLVKRMGERLTTEGYRGFFEVDVLVDTDTDEVYLGELNPRISGASAITNVTAGAYADVPLFLFHLLEYLEIDFELDIDEINARWEMLSGADTWSQMIIKETSDTVELLTATPATGQYHLDANGALVFGRAAMDWHMLQNESEAFFLRIYGPGDYRWKGGDLGILVTKGRLQVQRNGSTQLSIRAKHFIDSIRAGFAGLPLDGGLQGQELPASAGIGVKTRW